MNREIWEGNGWTLEFITLPYRSLGLAQYTFMRQTASSVHNVRLYRIESDIWNGSKGTIPM